MTPEQRTERNRVIAVLCGWYVVGPVPIALALNEREFAGQKNTA
jgi:hypothetical protein